MSHSWMFQILVTAIAFSNLYLSVDAGALFTIDKNNFNVYENDNASITLTCRPGSSRPYIRSLISITIEKRAGGGLVILAGATPGENNERAVLEDDSLAMRSRVSGKADNDNIRGSFVQIRMWRVTQGDAGSYYCRVNFMSPGFASRTSVDIIDVKIYDKRSSPIRMGCEHCPKVETIYVPINKAKDLCPTDFLPLEESCKLASDHGYRMIRTTCLAMCIRIVGVRRFSRYNSPSDFVEVPIETYVIAKASCAADGGRLVILNTLLRNALVQHAVLNNTEDSGDMLMIGGKYDKDEGEWQWLHDRSQFTFTDYAKIARSPIEECVYLLWKAEYRWIMDKCSDRTSGYICEIAL